MGNQCSSWVPVGPRVSRGGSWEFERDPMGIADSSRGYPWIVYSMDWDYSLIFDLASTWVDVSHVHQTKLIGSHGIPRGIVPGSSRETSQYTMESRGLRTRSHGDHWDYPRYTAGHRGFPWDVPRVPVGCTTGIHGNHGILLVGSHGGSRGDFPWELGKKHNNGKLCCAQAFEIVYQVYLHNMREKREK